MNNEISADAIYGTMEAIIETLKKTEAKPAEQIYALLYTAYEYGEVTGKSYDDLVNMLSLIDDANRKYHKERAH